MIKILQFFYQAVVFYAKFLILKRIGFAGRIILSILRRMR